MWVWLRLNAEKVEIWLGTPAIVHCSALTLYRRLRSCPPAVVASSASAAASAKLSSYSSTIPRVVANCTIMSRDTQLADTNRPCHTTLYSTLPPVSRPLFFEMPTTCRSTIRSIFAGLVWNEKCSRAATSSVVSATTKQSQETG